MNIAIIELEAVKEKLLNAGRYRKNRRSENALYYREEIKTLDNSIEILKQANGAEQSKSNCNIPLVSVSFLSLGGAKQN